MYCVVNNNKLINEWVYCWKITETHCNHIERHQKTYSLIISSSLFHRMSVIFYTTYLRSVPQSSEDTKLPITLGHKYIILGTQSYTYNSKPTHPNFD